PGPPESRSGASGRAAPGSSTACAAASTRAPWWAPDTQRGVVAARPPPRHRVAGRWPCCNRDSGPLPAGAQEHRARLHPAVDTELGVDAADVNPDGLLADEQPLRDLPVGAARGELGEHLQLAGGEGGELVVDRGGRLRLRRGRRLVQADP